jgi:pimeloyl-ACP methyl ester carboxylesterase
MTNGMVCFSHGKESGPWGTKIQALADIARALGWAVESLDYRGMEDPQQRVDTLTGWCHEQTVPVVLAGSSMGGHVATAAAANALGLFVVAPAFFVPGYEGLTPKVPTCPVTVVHGWRDEVIPWQNSVRFAADSHAKLVLLDGDHGLIGTLDEVCRQFTLFLESVTADMVRNADV